MGRAKSRASSFATKSEKEIFITTYMSSEDELLEQFSCFNSLFQSRS